MEAERGVLSVMHGEGYRVSTLALNQFVQGGIRLGVPEDEISRIAGFPEGWRDLEMLNLDMKAIADLVRHIERTSGSELFGFLSASDLRPTNYGNVGLIAIACPNLYEIVTRIPIYECLVGNVGRTVIEEKGRYLHINWVCSCPEMIVRWQLVDNTFASWVGFARWLTGMDLKPVVCMLRRPAFRLQEEVVAVEKFMGCPLVFEAEKDAIVVEKAVLEEARLPSYGEMLPVFEMHARSLVDRQKEADEPWKFRVRSLIRESLENRGVVRKELVAEQLGMSSRTLHRKLIESGVTYHDLVESLRCEMVKAFLVSGETVGTLARHLGFSEVRSFQRWFKQKFGCTVSEWREETRTQNPMRKRG